MLERAGPRLLRHWIERAAARDPDKAFIVAADDGRTLSFGQLRELTGRIATCLRDKGIGANDRVALLSNNSIEHLAAYFGVPYRLVAPAGVTAHSVNAVITV